MFTSICLYGVDRGGLNFIIEGEEFETEVEIDEEAELLDCQALHSQDDYNPFDQNSHDLLKALTQDPRFMSLFNQGKKLRSALLQIPNAPTP